MSQHHVESDGIDEALGGVTQVAMTAAGRVGEQLAREMERRARMAQAQSEQAAAEMAERARAEREAARASLAPVHQDAWWDNASAQDITKAYETAKAWRDVDPEAVRAEQRIAGQVRDRYGVDVADAGDPAAVSEAMDRSERARSEAAEERTDATLETAEAVGLVAGADALDRRVEEEVERMHEAADRGDATDANHHGAEADQAQGQAGEQREQAGHLYDSAERRQETAQGLDHIENRAAVEARMTADVAQARPATDAVAQAPGRAPSPRPNRQTPQVARQTQRGMSGR